MKFETAHIKKGDLVMITTGKEKGKSGKVLEVDSKNEQIRIEKLNIVKKHMKPNNQYRQGGIVEKEAPLHWSNVMMMCSKCNKPVRIKHKTVGEDKKRTCAKCGELFDVK